MKTIKEKMLFWNVLFMLFMMSGVGRADPPNENRYDVLGKVLAPLANVLLSGLDSKKRAVRLEWTISEVTGRLPKSFEGSLLSAAAQFPDKVKLTAPVLGEQVVLCRNGSKIWIVPGAKAEYLLSQFKIDSIPARKVTTPLSIPFTPSQIAFLPALFVVEEGGIVAKDGQDYRVLKIQIMPELAKKIHAANFRATLWVGSNNVPAQIRLEEKDFTMTLKVIRWEFVPALSPETWLPPEGNSDIFTCSDRYLEALINAVMNSLQKGDADTPKELVK